MVHPSLHKNPNDISAAVFIYGKMLIWGEKEEHMEWFIVELPYLKNKKHPLWVNQRNDNYEKTENIETREWKNGATNYSSEEGVTYH